MSKKILAIFGKAGSGKDTICKYLCQNFNANKLVRTTTRPKRDHEIEGVEYFFKDKESFTQMILDEEIDFLEMGIFNDWYYGTLITDVKEGWNITTCDVDAVYQMMHNYDDIEVYPIYINATDKIRMLRALNREENPNVKEIVRRYESDEYDYSDIDFEYILIDNSGEFDPDNIIKELLKNNIDLVN